MIGCLCIHGFTGAPYEVEPLAHYLQEHHPDWTFRIPTLPGHGEPLVLKGIKFQQWIDCAEKELGELLEFCEKVYVVGFSMGGLIASYLASRFKVDKLVLLSAAAYYLNPSQMAAEVKEMAIDAIKGNLPENELFLRYKRKITETPISAAMQFRRLVAFIRPLLNQVRVPVMIAQGESDGLVPPKSAEYLYETVGSKCKKLIYIKDSNHHICHCREKESLFSQVLDFLDDTEDSITC